MKKYLFFPFLLFLSCSTALANWSEIFRETCIQKGIDEAVVNALSEGYSPDQIMKTALPIENVQPEELIKALYCALVPPAYISDSAEANSIAREKVISGYELALAQCAEEMEEKQSAQAAPFTGSTAPAAGRTINASPSAF